MTDAPGQETPAYFEALAVELVRLANTQTKIPEIARELIALAEKYMDKAARLKLESESAS